jgi:SnoaL-like domain
MAYDSSALIDALREGDRGRLAGLLADEVVFDSPVATYDGAEQVLLLLATISDVIDDLRVERELPDGDGAVTFVAGRIGEHDVDGVLVQAAGDDGRLVHLRLMLRPLAGLLTGVKQMAERLA